jgi:hypothetical protein
MGNQFRNLIEQLLWSIAAFAEKMISNQPLRGNAINSPLIAMTGMWGKRRRTTESSSNPFMFGMRKSEIRMSGGDLQSSTRAAKPSAAVLASKPLLSKILAE